MIPLRDINPTTRFPMITYTIIAVTAAVFLFEQLVGPAGMQTLVDRFGLVPSVFASGDLFVPRSQGGAAGAWVTPVTSLFLHGGWLHLLSNLWFLHVFGDNVEDTLGRGRFVAFYLACGVAAGFAHALLDLSSPIPLVGASGAISGVLAAYLVLFPMARVIALTPVFVEVPAFVFVFVWFGLQVLYAYLAPDAGVAWFAHIGGFLAGLVLIFALMPRRPSRPGRRGDDGGDLRPRFDRAPGG